MMSMICLIFTVRVSRKIKLDTKAIVLYKWDMSDRIINSINTVQDHIIESEMESEIDKTDSWYPIFEALEELKDKRFNELELDK